VNSTSVPVSTEGPASENSLQARRSPEQVPGVFLMTNSFERGGSERQFVELACALQPEHFRVSLGCIQTIGPFRDAVGAVETYPLGGSLYRWQSIRTRLRLAGELRRQQIAIAHAFDYYTNLTLIPAARLARTPIVIGSQRQLGDLLTPRQERAQALVFRWADCVICNSQAAAGRLAQNGFPAEKLAVIGNGLPPHAFAPAAPGVPREPGIFRIGMIARMNASSKNHALLLEVAARLRGRMKSFEILLAGDGPLRAELERKAEDLGVKDIVRFLGDLQDVQAVLASVDVTVLPSASESLSNSILESMAAGVPVIANRLGGNSELLGDDRGILVPPNDGEAMATAVQRLSADDSLRQAFARNARTFALENFTIERMRNRHEELYRRLLEKKGWRSAVPHGTN